MFKDKVITNKFIRKSTELVVKAVFIKKTWLFFKYAYNKYKYNIFVFYIKNVFYINLVDN